MQVKVKVKLYDEAEKFASISGKGSMIAIKEITLEPEDQYISIEAKDPLEKCRELAAFELSKHIINRLGYRVESKYEGQYKYYIFHIATLIEVEKLKLIKEINVLQETIEAYETNYTSNEIVSLIKAEARNWKDLYHCQLNKSLWTIIKERLFK